MRFLRPAIVVSVVLLLDQSIKFWVTLSFTYNESRRVFSWFYLYFIENEGMAFGMSLGGDSGKLLLSLFRILAVTGIGYYLMRIVNEKAHPGFIISMSLIFAGALGNIIDSVFYGKFFSASSVKIASVLFPAEGGYAGWLHGRVVDMFYFPLYEGFLPNWIPVYGGDYFIFFRPIFNVADASITTGVFLIILFQKRFFRRNAEKIEPPESDTLAARDNTPTS